MADKVDTKSREEDTFYSSNSKLFFAGVRVSLSIQTVSRTSRFRSTSSSSFSSGGEAGGRRRNINGRRGWRETRWGGGYTGLKDLEKKTRGGDRDIEMVFEMIYGIKLRKGWKEKLKE